MPSAEFLITEVEETNSTMDLCRSVSLGTGNSALGGAEDGEWRAALFVAHTQSAGRGRQGRSWVSPQGGFYATAFVPLTCPVAKLSGFSLAVGVVLAEVLAELGCESRLKWPNDILAADGKKLAGILIEIAEDGGRLAALVGIGLNLQNFKELPQEATSLETIIGRVLTPREFAEILVAKLPTLSAKFEQGGFSEFRKEWMQRAAYLQEEVAISEGTSKIFGHLDDVGPSGELILRVDGEQRIFTSGDVSLRPAN